MRRMIRCVHRMAECNLVGSNCTYTAARTAGRWTTPSGFCIAKVRASTVCSASSTACREVGVFVRESVTSISKRVFLNAEGSDVQKHEDKRDSSAYTRQPPNTQHSRGIHLHCFLQPFIMACMTFFTYRRKVHPRLYVPTVHA
jgi:hypothetical protein